MASCLQDMYLWLVFSPEAAKLLKRKQGLDSPDRLQVLTDKIIDVIGNVIRKPGFKNADKVPYRGQHVSIIVQENLKPATFLFHHRWSCTFD